MKKKFGHLYWRWVSCIISQESFFFFSIRKFWYWLFLILHTTYFWRLRTSHTALFWYVVFLRRIFLLFLPISLMHRIISVSQIQSGIHAQNCLRISPLNMRIYQQIYPVWYKVSTIAGILYFENNRYIV